MFPITKPIRIIGRMMGQLSSAGWYISPHGFNLYRAQPGDTFASLASEYLGDDGKGDAIFQLQSGSWQNSHSSGDLTPGDELFMPQAAIDQAKQLGFAVGGAGMPPASLRGAGSVDVLGGGGGSNVVVIPEVVVPGNVPKPKPATPTAPSSKKAMPIGLVLGGLAGVGALGAVGYVVAKKHARRANPRRHARRHNPRSWHGCDET